MKKKILLLNPPSKRNNLMRDYNCSHTSKGSYLYPALDLYIISGFLNPEEYDVFVIDSIAERLTEDQVEKKVFNINPHVVIALIGVLSFKEDLKLLKRFSSLGSKIFLIGDISYFQPAKIMKEYSFVEGIFFDFTSSFFLQLLEGRYRGLKDVAYRKGNKIIISERSHEKLFFLPKPRVDLFPLNKYSLPYGRYSPLASVISSYGCPNNCKYCVYSKMDYKERDIDNLIEELFFLQENGVKEFIFKDTAFNTNLKRAKEICRKIIQKRIHLAWSCDLTAHNCDIELLKLMKKAGCYLVMVGIETLEDSSLKNVHKPLSKERIIDFIKICKKTKMLVLGHFILGLPGDSEESMKRTIEFSKNCGCDYASFNLFVAKVGTDMRKELMSKGMINEDDYLNLDSTTECIELDIPKERILELHKKAIKEFYFRPSHIVRQIFLIRSSEQFINLVRNGYEVVMSLIKKKDL